MEKTVPRFDIRMLDEEEEKTQLDRGWSVILYNDNVNPFEFVIISIIKIMRFSLEKAISHTKEADENGRTVLAITHKERAELLVQQLGSLGLTSDMEQI